MRIGAFIALKIINAFVTPIHTRTIIILAYNPPVDPKVKYKLQKNVHHMEKCQYIERKSLYFQFKSHSDVEKNQNIIMICIYTERKKFNKSNGLVIVNQHMCIFAGYKSSRHFN